MEMGEFLFLSAKSFLSHLSTAGQVEHTSKKAWTKSEEAKENSMKKAVEANGTFGTIFSNTNTNENGYQSNVQWIKVQEKLWSEVWLLSYIIGRQAGISWQYGGHSTYTDFLYDRWAKPNPRKRSWRDSDDAFFRTAENNLPPVSAPKQNKVKSYRDMHVFMNCASSLHFRCALITTNQTRLRAFTFEWLTEQSHCIKYSM